MMSKAAQELFAKIDIKPSERIALSVAPAVEKTAPKEDAVPRTRVSAACWE